MILQPITPELATTSAIADNEFLTELCASVLSMYSRSSSFHPWVGYLAEEHGVIVGTCAFKTPPIFGEVEIGYFTFPEHEGRGVASRMAGKLVELAIEHGITVIKAQTLPENNASTHLLDKLGFEFSTPVIHPEDGEVWEWRLEASRSR